MEGEGKEGKMGIGDQESLQNSTVITSLTWILTSLTSYVAKGKLLNRSMSLSQQ